MGNYNIVQVSEVLVMEIPLVCLLLYYRVDRGCKGGLRSGINNSVLVTP